MKLIADGGSTNTDWRLIGDDDAKSFQTKGINPFFNSEEQIIKVINQAELGNYSSSIKEVYFYGAGLATKEAKLYMTNAFKKVFKNAGIIKTNDDLIGAARALLGTNKGIACILGTGSNSCLYNGHTIEDKVPALGYILGDEGSGGYIGIRFINGLLKRQYSDELTAQLNKAADLTMDTILPKVYKEELPNRYLASLTQLINQHIEHPEMYQLVYDAFNAFINKNIRNYKNFTKYPIGFVGSIAYYFKPILNDVLNHHGLNTGKIIKAPIDELVNFHLNKNI